MSNDHINRNDTPSEQSSSNGAPDNSSADRSSPPQRWTRREERTEPRRVRSGIKLRTSEASLLVDRRSAGWVHLARRMCSQAGLARGIEFATNGQTVAIDIYPSRSNVVIQAMRKQPHAVVVRIAPWSESQWRNVIERLTEHASHAASILTGDMPEAIVSTLEREDLALIPTDPAEVTIEVDAPDEIFPVLTSCALHMLAQRTHEEPLSLFTLRGMPVETLVERLRQNRMIQSHGVAPAHPHPHVSAANEPGAPLEETIEYFWRAPEGAPPVRDSNDRPTRSTKHVSHALLRRLGPSPLTGRFPIVGLLASVYDEVTADLVADADHRAEVAESMTDAPGDV